MASVFASLDERIQKLTFNAMNTLNVTNSKFALVSDNSINVYGFKIIKGELNENLIDFSIGNYFIKFNFNEKGEFTYYPPCNSIASKFIDLNVNNTGFYFLKKNPEIKSCVIVYLRDDSEDLASSNSSSLEVFNDYHFLVSKVNLNIDDFVIKTHPFLNSIPVKHNPSLDI